MRDIKRGERRHQTQKRKVRAQRKWAEWGLTTPYEQNVARKNFEHMRKCSCWLCGHRREREGLTIQELRSLQRLNDE